MLTTIALLTQLAVMNPVAADAPPTFFFDDSVLTPDVFSPTNAELNVTDDGVWIMAFDRDGALVGDLQMVFADDHIDVDATFWKGSDPDGHVWMRLTNPDPVGGSPAEMQTDLDDPALAVARVSTMLGFVPLVPPSAPMPISKRRCMLYFAGAAITCGIPVVFPPTGPAAVAVVWACVWTAFQTVCECQEHFSFKICPD